jgi:uncharacterized repeat protein (TIGR01451 family)
VVQIFFQASTAGVYTNRATAGTASIDLIMANNTGTQAANVIAAADVGISAVSATTNLLQGQNLVSVFVVTNRGPDTAVVQFSDPLPPGVAFVSATTSRGACTNLGNSVACELGTLQSGESANVTVSARTLTSGAITNTASVTSSIADLSSGNNSASVLATVTPTIPQPRFVAIQRVGQIVTLSLTTEAGINYAVEYKEALGGAIWSPLASIEGTGGIVTMNDPLAISQTRFYRARTQ